MQQITQYLAGERNYVKVYGDTGPLVYPAAHVYIYRFLHYLTNEGRDIRTAQLIFTALYLSSLTLVMLCYRQAKVPPYIFPLLVLSKRLHSVFLLRLFNDCFAVFFLFAAIYAYQKRMWTIGLLMYSVGLGIKMSLLLALPAVGMVLWHAVGRGRALKQAVLMAQVQVMLGYPFLAQYPKAYLSRAFEFSRQFLFKWTVNWRFVGEQTFQSKPFSLGLLAAHAVILAAFGATRWLKPVGATMSEAGRLLMQPPSAAEQAKIGRRVTPDYILTTVLSAIVTGCLCARSLHYQFYAYIAWSTPFLLWRSGLHPVLIYAIWAAQEWAWNIYPSTDASSMVVVGCLTLTIACSWWGTGQKEFSDSGDKERVDHQHFE